MTDTKFIYWFCADGDCHTKCYWPKLSNLGKVVCVPPPEMIDEIRPWEKVIDTLEELIKKTEGDMWESLYNTKNRVFIGHSGGLRGCLLASAKDDGPWCGAVVGWCGWSNPEEIFTEKYSLETLISNVWWEEMKGHQILLFVEPRKRKEQVEGCTYDDAALLRDHVGKNKILIMENTDIKHDSGINKYVEFIDNFLHKD